MFGLCLTCSYFLNFLKLRERPVLTELFNSLPLYNNNNNNNNNNTIVAAEDQAISTNCFKKNFEGRN